MDEKTCRVCGETKPATTEFFAPRTDRPGGARSECRICQASYHAAYNAAHHEEKRSYNAAYHAAHREDKIAYNAAYYAAHREERIAYLAAHRKESAASAAAYYAAHSVEIRARTAVYLSAHRDESAAYRASHRAECRANEHNRYARERNSPGHHTGADIASIRAGQGNRCFWCGEPLGVHWHLDHYIPLSRGGSNWPENLDVACASCNLHKSNMMPGEFLETLDRSQLT